MYCAQQPGEYLPGGIGKQSLACLHSHSPPPSPLPSLTRRPHLPSCIQVNSDQNVATKAPVIGKELNRQNNRHCVPFKFNSLPQVSAPTPHAPASYGHVHALCLLCGLLPPAPHPRPAAPA